MWTFTASLIILFSLCNGSKRLRAESTGMMTRKRSKTIVGSLKEAVRHGDVSSFARICEDEDFNTPFADIYLDNQVTDNLITMAIECEYAKLLQRMLKIDLFAEALDFSHLNYAIHFSPPDVLQELVRAWPQSLLRFGSCFSKYKSEVEGLFYAADSASPVHVRILARIFNPPDETISSCTRHHPAVFPLLLRKYLECRRIKPKAIDFEMLTLGGRHANGPLFNTFFYNNIWAAKPDAVHATRPPMFLKLEKILVALNNCDKEELSRIMGKLGYTFEDLLQVRLMAFDAAISRGMYDFIDALTPPKNKDFLAIRFHLSSNYFYSTIGQALLDDKVDTAVEAIRDLSISFSDGMLHNMVQEIFRHWMDAGDLGSILHSSPYMLRFPNLPDRQLSYIKLAERAFQSDWRYLLIFMEMHSNKLLVAETAWDIIFNVRPTDLFIRFLQDALENVNT